MEDELQISFKYKNHKGQISQRRILPGKVYYGSTEFHPHPQLLMEGFDLDKKEDRTFALRDIIFEPIPKNFKIGDKVRFIPTFPSQRTLEGIICFIEGERIYFFSGIMPTDFYGTDMAKKPGKSILHNDVLYDWELMIHRSSNLEKI